MASSPRAGVTPSVSAAGAARSARADVTRVAAVLSRPVARRAPLLDRVAALPEIDLRVVGRGGRTGRLVDRAYASTLGVRRRLASLSPDVVVAGGWSSLSAQSAIAWSRLARVP